MSAIGNILNRLFSQKVIIKRMPGDRLKTIDFDKLQSIGNSLTGRFSGVRTSLNNNSYYGSGYSTETDMSIIDSARNTMYIDYESMESDAILAAALDIYADECTVKNEQHQMLQIQTEDDVKKKILYNLYHDILNIEFNLWYWIRSLCKYGDFFIYLPSAPNIGIVDAIPIHPSLIRRNDFAGEHKDQTEYYYEGDPNAGFARTKTNSFGYHEMAHFRILTDANYLPYGKSLLEGARKTYKQLAMMEDAMLIHRIMRAPERRIFKIDVGNLPPESIDAYMEEITNSMKKVPYIDPNTGDYNLRFNLMNMLEDFYLPTRGGEGGTSVETLPGLSSEGNLQDIDYLQKKMMAYLKIPRAYLGYDEGVEGKGTLAAEDIKFARFVERIQNIVLAELEKIGHIHLYHQGYSGDELTDFTLKLSTPSVVYERQKVDLMNQKLQLIQIIKENKLFSKKWVYENLFNLTIDEWNEQQDLIIEDLKREFREEQIKTEGNDPLVTGKSFGTPHDIVTMQMASKAAKDQDPSIADLYRKDARHDNPGRPEKRTTWERPQDQDFGHDPTGRKELNRPINASKDITLLMKSLKPKSQILSENAQKLDNIQMLNEDSLLNDAL